jgi:hypothetical protein
MATTDAGKVFWMLVPSISLAGDADVAREDAYARPMTDRMPAIAEPQPAAGKLDASQMPLRIALGDHRVDDHAGVLAEPDRQVERASVSTSGPLASSGRCRGRPDGRPGAPLRPARMADVEHRECRVRRAAFEVGQDFLLALQIERGQRLVHQQDARADGQRAGDADAAAFAAGEPIRLAVEQGRDAEQFDGLIEADAAAGCAAVRFIP